MNVSPNVKDTEKFWVRGYVMIAGFIRRISMPLVHGLLLLLLFASGCIVRPAADTILTVAKSGGASAQKQRLGFRDAMWTETDDECVIIASGWHPREHETYAFFICEPYPLLQRRHIRITCGVDRLRTDDVKKVELILDSSLLDFQTPVGQMALYVGSTQSRIGSFFGGRSVSLKNLTLRQSDNPDQTVTVSGRIVAGKATEKKISWTLEQFDSFRKSGPQDRP